MAKIPPRQELHGQSPFCIAPEWSLVSGDIDLEETKKGKFSHLC